MTLRSLAVLTIVALGAVSWSGARADSVEDELDQAHQKKWADFFNAKDAAGLAMHYTEDALQLPPDATRVEGRAAIQEVFKEEFDAGVTNIKLENTDVGHDGNLAWLVGNWSVDFPTDKGDMATATGNYVAVYRKEADGVWRMVIDTWNEAPSPSE
jgi:uncharacterized protein (TIGR02246 family)